MRSAQSRLGVVTSLGAARRGVGSCVEALPVSLSALKMGGVAVAGIAGVALLGGLLSSRSGKAKTRPAPKATASAASVAHKNVGSYLLSEAVVTLLLPLCRRYFLGELCGTVPPGAVQKTTAVQTPPARGLLARLFSTGR